MSVTILASPATEQAGPSCLFKALKHSLNSRRHRHKKETCNPLISQLVEQEVKFVPSPGNWESKILEILKMNGATILSSPSIISHDSFSNKCPSLNPDQFPRVNGHSQYHVTNFDSICQEETPPLAPTSLVKHFSYGSVELNHTYLGSPFGFVNEANYCYMISTLQVLLHTEPFINFALLHHRHCALGMQRWCAICEFYKYYSKYQSMGQTSAFYPRAFMRHITLISPTLHPNRQEDAHEFLRGILDYMEKNTLFGTNKANNHKSKSSNPIKIIFGGKLKSTVSCTRCHEVSQTFDDFLDLSLCIQHTNTLEESLVKFVSVDTLKDSNAYKCEKCKMKVTAKKKFSIALCPPILTIQFNRFQWGHSQKISKFIKFPKVLDTRPYMSKPGRSLPYSLYAAIQHRGVSTKYGHYFSYVHRNNQWWCVNDSSVSRASESDVLLSSPYILLYKRSDMSTLVKHSVTSTSAETTSVSNCESKQSFYEPSSSSFCDPNSSNIPAPTPPRIIFHKQPVKLLVKPAVSHSASSSLTNGASSSSTPTTNFVPRTVFESLSRRPGFQNGHTHSQSLTNGHVSKPDLVEFMSRKAKPIARWSSEPSTGTVGAAGDSAVSLNKTFGASGELSDAESTSSIKLKIQRLNGNSFSCSPVEQNKRTANQSLSSSSSEYEWVENTGTANSSVASSVTDSLEHPSMKKRKLDNCQEKKQKKKKHRHHKHRRRREDVN